MKQAVAVGIDLAWSPKNTTGVAAADVESDSVCVTSCGLIHTTDEIVGFVAEAWGGGPMTVAIDCPTIVPNETGIRPCEMILQQRFSKSHAGPYPANRRRLGQYNSGTPRGEEVSRALQVRLGAVECGVPPLGTTGST